MAQTSVSTHKKKLMLVGKTGAGKSATGNSILGWSAFDVSGEPQSITNDIKYEFSEFDGLRLQVIDMPGLENTHLSQADDKAKFLSNVIKALSACNGVIDAIVLVYRYGDQLTSEMQNCLNSIMTIIGEDVMRKSGIIAMTNGTDWYQDNEEENGFQEWCKTMNSDYKGLFEKCGFRCVLIENTKTDFEEARGELLNLLSETSACTNENFEAAAIERTQFMAEIKSNSFKNNQKEKLSRSTEKKGATNNGNSGMQEVEAEHSDVGKINALAEPQGEQKETTSYCSSI